MTKIRTEKGAIKSSVESLFLIEKAFKSTTDVVNILDALPGCIHLNSTTDITDKFSNSGIEEIYQASSEEIHERGIEIMQKCIHPDEYEFIPPLIFNFIQKSDLKGTLNLFQRIRSRIDREDCKWFFTSTKVLSSNPENLISISHFVDLVVTSNKVNKLLDDHIFLRKNLSKFLSLTNREREILAALAEGQTAPQIAEQKFISLNMVKTHRQRIKEKLGVKTYKELHQYAFHFDLLG